MPVIPLKPFWTTSDKETVKLYLGDVIAVLKRMPSQSVHCVVTSPPYWALRDYGTAEWEGGDENCDHSSAYGSKHGGWNGNNKNPDCTARTSRHAGTAGTCSRVCPRCGAKRIDCQIGIESSVDEYVAKMVEVFREVRRVLRDDGVCWLNLGDSYSGGGGGGYSPDSPSNQNGSIQAGERKGTGSIAGRIRSLPSGNLVGVPWRVALALQANGWILRQDIIWSKPSPMPESVRNRCTKSHEYIFLLAKRSGYFYDADAIREPHAEPERSTGKLERMGPKKNAVALGVNQGFGLDGERHRQYNSNGRNKRSVWSIASFGYPGAHFATFPPALVEPCLLAGTSEYGCCGECGAPWRRVVEQKQLRRERPNEWTKYRGDDGTGNSCPNTIAGVETKTVGWEPTCTCKFYRLRDGTPEGIIEELRSLGLVE